VNWLSEYGSDAVRVIIKTPDVKSGGPPAGGAGGTRTAASEGGHSAMDPRLDEYVPGEQTEQTDCLALD